VTGIRTMSAVGGGKRTLAQRRLRAYILNSIGEFVVPILDCVG
jgi:hypothetical protein